MIKKHNLFLIEIVVVIFTCAGCATVRHPVPQNLIQKASLGDMSDIRIIIGMPSPKLQESLIRSVKEENPEDYPTDLQGRRVYPILCISGGAANGAYGAGLLKGWSLEGSRPKFKVVTGVSTGAIIAPMVFLGKDYDGQIEELYTTMSTKDVMSMKGPIRILFGSSLASNKPLERQLDKYVDENLLKNIADEHRRGRRLFVGTTHLDAQRFVVWDMGAIASRGDIKLFKKVILASSAIPIVFPPVYIHVEADGGSYDEMHVDGGTVTQVFTLYNVLEGQEKVARQMDIDSSKMMSKCYIIRNGYVSPGYKVVKGNIASIAGQSLDTIINNQGIGDTYRIYAFMKKRGNDYNLAFIPGDFRPESKEEFDPNEMKKLFDRGYQDAVKGYKWHKVPPGLDSENL